MYTIIGSDQREYGPVSQEEVKKWILEGRISKNTLAKSEATGEWKPLGEYPEFADVFAQLAPPPLASSSQSYDEKQLVESLLNRDYELKVRDCVSRGFNLYKENFWLLFGATIIHPLIVYGGGILIDLLFIGVRGRVLVNPSVADHLQFEFLNLLNNFILLFLNPILIGGLFYIFITKIRGGNVNIGGLFYGFKRKPLHIILTRVVMLLLLLVAVLPFALSTLFVISNFVSYPSIIRFIGIIIGLIITVASLIYLSVCWTYSIPIVIDKGLDFWSAMKLSMKKVNQHWFSVLRLLAVMMIIYFAGILLCGIGLFFAAPLAIATFVYGYETIFGEARESC